MDSQARMDQRERADRIEPALAAEPIENTEASEPADATDRIASQHSGRQVAQPHGRHIWSQRQSGPYAERQMRSFTPSAGAA